MAGLPLLIQRLVDCLKDLEASVTVPPTSISSYPFKLNPHPVCLHRSHDIHDAPNFVPLQVWGGSVEVLWRILMSLKDASSMWGIVTSRMLVWRMITGATDDDAEWTRVQVVCSTAGK